MFTERVNVSIVCRIKARCPVKDCQNEALATSHENESAMWMHVIENKTFNFAKIIEYKNDNWWFKKCQMVETDHETRGWIRKNEFKFYDVFGVNPIYSQSLIFSTITKNIC